MALEVSLISSSLYKITMRGEERSFFFLFLAFCDNKFYRSCLGFVKLGQIVSCRLERRAQDLVAVVPAQGTPYAVTLFTIHVMKWSFLHVDIMTCSLFHVSLYA